MRAADSLLLLPLPLPLRMPAAMVAASLAFACACVSAQQRGIEITVPMLAPRGPAQPQPGAAVPAYVPPSRSSGGPCRVELSEDRYALTLVGADELPHGHLGLGEFRAQAVIHAPDGRWAVAFTKLRGQPRYAATAIDLQRCEPGATYELQAAGEGAHFDGDDAVLRAGGREMRVRLPESRVR